MRVKGKYSIFTNDLNHDFENGLILFLGEFIS